MSDLGLNAVINERYRLDAQLGQGGMGTVFRAHDLTLTRDVALKLMSNTKLGTEGRARMLREAQVVANLHHPNIVAVHDAGEVQEQPFIVMEYVDGQTLDKAEIRDIPEIIRVINQVCDALEHAHKQGIVHRDLKPENIIIQPDGTVKLMDFGLARSAASRMTQEGTVVGTVFYMAPEQALGDEVDHRADLYSLGALLYEQFTGSLPFESDDFIAVITQHLHAPVVPPRAKRPDLPRHLDERVVHLLNKDPENRPANIAEVRGRLNTASRDSDVSEVAGLDRIVRGRLVGRDAELQQARNAWQAARQGQGHALLISGEPGVGKTRFTQEIITQAEVSGGRTLFGASYQESNAPYGPFAQMVRTILRRSDGGVPDVPDLVLADLLTLAPDLRAYYPEVPANPKLEGTAEQQRIYQNFIAFLEQLSGDSPLLIVMDDIHWADSGTLDLSRHLVRRVGDLPILFIGTYREVEISGSADFSQALADFNRETITARIKLDRLTPPQTRRLLETMFEDTITDDFLNGIYKETEGNPFFIEEVCKALVDSGKLYFADGEWHRPEMDELEIPQSVMVAIQSRVGKLPAEVRETLLLAAVIGREFEYEVLAGASELDEDALIDVIEHAERTQLIEELPRKGETVFQFCHALVPATMLEEVSSLRVRRQHGRIANTYLKVHPGRVQALAYHFIEAGDLEHGLEYAEKAGQEAAASFATLETIKAYGQALECAEALGLKNRVIEFHDFLGEINLEFSYPIAIEHFEKARQLTDDPNKRAVFQSKVAWIQVNGGDSTHIEEMKAILPLVTDESKVASNESAWAYYTIGRSYHLQAQYQKALEYFQEGLKLVLPSEDIYSIYGFFIGMAGTYQHLGMFEESNKWANESIRAGREKNYPSVEAVGYEFLSENHVFMGNWREGLENAQKNYNIGDQYGFMGRKAWSLMASGGAYLGFGELSAALAAYKECSQIALELDDTRLDVMAHTGIARTWIYMDQIEEALVELEKQFMRSEQLGELQLFNALYAGRSEIHMLKEEWEQAEEWMDKAWERIGSSQQEMASG